MMFNVGCETKLLIPAANDVFITSNAATIPMLKSEVATRVAVIGSDNCSAAILTAADVNVAVIGNVKAKPTSPVAVRVAVIDNDAATTAVSTNATARVAVTDSVV